MAASLRTILSQTDTTGQREIHLLVNPVAGGVARHATLAASVQITETYAAGLHAKSFGAVSVRTHYTTAPGHASQIVAELVAKPRDGELVVVSAGGDGTHGEVLRVLVDAAEPIDATAIRLPMGTGNDGADAPTFAEACGLLTFGTRLTGVPFVRVTEATGRRHYAFNIASLGLDAYVTDVGNRLKRIVPGDIYKGVADVATLFYEPVFGIRESRALLETSSGERETVAGRFIIFAFGATGRRSYGDGKTVLPGEENLCAIETVGLRRKLELKSLLYAGRHTAEPEVTMRSCRRLELHYDGKVPMQLDGEGVWLTADSFPLTMEVSKAPIGRLTMNGTGV